MSEQYFKDAQLGTVRFRDRKQDAHGVPVQPRDIAFPDPVPAMHHHRLVAAIVTDIRVGAGMKAPTRLKFD